MHVRNELGALLEGTLPAHRTGEVFAHLRACAPCREAFVAEMALLRALGGGASSPLEDVAVARRVLAERPAPARRALMLGATFALATSALLLSWRAAHVVGEFRSLSGSETAAEERQEAPTGSLRTVEPDRLAHVVPAAPRGA